MGVPWMQSGTIIGCDRWRFDDVCDRTRPTPPRCFGVGAAASLRARKTAECRPSARRVFVGGRPRARATFSFVAPRVGLLSAVLVGVFDCVKEL